MRTTLATLLLGISTAAADPIQIDVRGSVDADVVANSIGDELRKPVQRVDDECKAPCLSVVVEDNQATVVFTTEDGSVRTRTVALGDDQTQWPTLITLLAGNLVRDEASEVLPLIPAAPVAAPPPPPAAPAPHHRNAGIAVGLVPVLSTDLVDLSADHDLAVWVFAGLAHDVDGISASGVVDVAYGKMDGLQLAGVVAVANKASGLQIGGTVAATLDDTGVQVGGVVAASGGKADVQFGGVVAASLDDADLQIGGVVAASAGKADVQFGGVVAASLDDADLQIGGVVAAATGNADLQIAGAVAVSTDETDLQIAGAVAVADHVDGLQIAGAVNVAGDVDGMQIAPVNIAGHVDGVQVGVINIGGGPDNEAIGLINIVPGGRTDIEATVDSSSLGAVMLRHGGRHFHNVYGIAGQRNDAGMDDVWMYGLGLGPSFHIASVPVDVEAIAWEVNHGSHQEDHLSLLGQLRVTVEVPHTPVVVGAAFNTYVSTDHTSPFIVERSTSPGSMASTDATVRLWPSVFVGARL